MLVCKITFSPLATDGKAKLSSEHNIWNDGILTLNWSIICFDIVASGLC